MSLAELLRNNGKNTAKFQDLTSLICKCKLRTHIQFEKITQTNVIKLALKFGESQASTRLRCYVSKSIFQINRMSVSVTILNSPVCIEQSFLCIDLPDTSIHVIPTSSDHTWGFFPIIWSKIFFTLLWKEEMGHNFGWRLRKSEDITIVSGGRFGSEIGRQNNSHFGKGLGIGLRQDRPYKLKNKDPQAWVPEGKD